MAIRDEIFKTAGFGRNRDRVVEAPRPLLRSLRNMTEFRALAGGVRFRLLATLPAARRMAPNSLRMRRPG